MKTTLDAVGDAAAARDQGSTSYEMDGSFVPA